MPFVTDFCMPFRYITNPRQDEVGSQSRQWMLAFDLVDPGHMFEYEIARIPELMSGAYPGIGATDLRLSCDAMGVMWCIEDADCGKHPRSTVEGITTRCKAMIAVMYDGETNTEDSVVRAFSDVWRRLCHGMSESWIERHRLNWDAFLENHYAWEPVVVKHHGMPAMSDFLRDRGTSTGMRVLYDWSERLSADRIEMPQQALEDPRLDTLGRLVIDTIIGINDTISLEREIRRDDNVPNLLKVLGHHEHLRRLFKTPCD